MDMNPEEIRILYVDDDEDDFLLVKTLLKKVKRIRFEVERARDMNDVLLKVNDPYDVFLVDYRLGRENGLDVLRAIRASRQFAPVIMLTGMEDGEIDQLALKEGAADYLIKGDFDPQILERTIRYALRDAMLIETLEISGQRFRNIFEKSADPIILIDEKGFIVKANNSFERLFGIRLGQGQEIAFSSLITQQQDLAIIDKAIIEGQVLDDFETEMITSDEKKLQVLISLVIHDSHKGNRQIMIKDLSSLREREEEKQNYAKFASTGRMARIIAHEVKNPLTNITLSADQLRAELPQPVLEESGDLIDVIDRNAKRINQLVSELLQSTRFTELNIHPHGINQLLIDTLDMAADRISLKKIRVKTQFSEDICDIHVDGEKLKIAFLNIIMNAIEAMEEGKGLLEIQTEVIGSKCIVRIADNGPGIPPDQLDKLFEPFFTSKEKGTGLGLTNAQNIILSHQGSIRVKSDQLTGTSFIISFNL